MSTDLITAALREQRHDALEAVVAPDEIIPRDLAVLLADFANESWFKLHGFTMHRAATGSSWWYAVLTGNGVVLEAMLRERGFNEAFNGAPSSCKVRMATAYEVAQYLAS